ncbi:MAG TPA: DUF167 domain-containing protein [Chthoniobacter sp.]
MKEVLRLRIVPNARRSKVVGMHGEALKVKVQAPATEGKANEALLEFLADRLGVPVRQLEILSGAKSRDKLVEITGMESEQALQRLLRLS